MATGEGRLRVRPLCPAPRADFGVRQEKLFSTKCVTQRIALANANARRQSGSSRTEISSHRPNSNAQPSEKKTRHARYGTATATRTPTQATRVQVWLSADRSTRPTSHAQLNFVSGFRIKVCWKKPVGGHADVTAIAMHVPKEHLSEEWFSSFQSSAIKIHIHAGELLQPRGRSRIISYARFSEVPECRVLLVGFRYTFALRVVKQAQIFNRIFWKKKKRKKKLTISTVVQRRMFGLYLEELN